MSQIKRHIAIIGAGFCGLASAYFLLQAGHRITLYDPSPIGENASGISAGLLHCYTGPKAISASDGPQKLNAAHLLFHAASDALGLPVAKQTGLLRPATNAVQMKHFQETAERHRDVHWLEASEVVARFEQLSPFPAIWIENAWQVDTKTYLKGLWKACEQLGAEWKATAVSSRYSIPEELCVIATGASPLLESAHLPFHPVKGQILKLEWDISLPFPISANIYLVPASSPHTCYLGGTFEHHFSSIDPDEEEAKKQLFPKLEKLLTKLPAMKILDCRAAVRASTPDRQPIMRQINPNTWILAGMGSKGLLNHAFYAQQLPSCF
jgi:glycine/D-amino acid oxidase-like deaminating enzyme